MYVQADIGISHRDIRSLPCLLAELIDDGVFHLVRYEFGMTEFLGEDDSVNSERLVLLQIFRPVYLSDFFIYVISTLRLEVADRLQYSDGSVQLEVGTIHHFFVTCKRNHSSTDFHILSPQLGQLFRQYRFQSHKRLGDQFKILFHYFT